MSVIRLPTPDDRAATFRAMARDRWREAVARKLAGDEQGYLDGLADVRALDEQAAEATVRAARVEIQQAKFDRDLELFRQGLEKVLGDIGEKRAAEALAAAIEDERDRA